MFQRRNAEVAITGTPMENNLMELWSLLSITAPGLFPSPNRFQEYYARPLARGGVMFMKIRLRPPCESRWPS